MDSDLKKDDLNSGNQFLSLLSTESARLDSLVFSAEKELETESDIPEDVKGKLRVAAGKGKMLLNKKFIQFEELCFKNLGIDSDIRYPVTSEDLAGYWDTILLQLLQVYNIFEEVDILRKNNWKEPANTPEVPIRKKKMARKLAEEKTKGDVIGNAEITSPTL